MLQEWKYFQQLHYSANKKGEGVTRWCITHVMERAMGPHHNMKMGKEKWPYFLAGGDPYYDDESCFTSKNQVFVTPILARSQKYQFFFKIFYLKKKPSELYWKTSRRGHLVHENGNILMHVLIIKSHVETMEIILINNCCLCLFSEL